jgi:hypothetical protein
MGTPPYPDTARDFAASDSITQTPREEHLPRLAGH